MNDLRIEKKKVLLVEDEPLVRALCIRVVNRLGYSIEAVKGVKDAFSYLDERSTDLLISDLNLNDGDGFDVVRKFQMKNISGKIILITGSEITDEMKEKALKNGVHYFIRKPFELDKFKTAVKENLD